MTTFFDELRNIDYVRVVMLYFRGPINLHHYVRSTRNLHATEKESDFITKETKSRMVSSFGRDYHDIVHYHLSPPHEHCNRNEQCF